MEFKTTPLAHQMDMFNQFKDSKEIALNGDMGVGKTKPVIDIAAYKYSKGEINRVLVIAPNGVHDQWLSEQFPTHCPIPYVSHIYRASAALKVLRERDNFLFQAKGFEKSKTRLMVMAINVEGFSRKSVVDLAQEFLDTGTGVMIVVDEASTIKTPDISTTKNIKKVKRRYKNSVGVAMTGTPAAKGPVDMWSIYDFIRKGYMQMSYIAFKMTHTVVYKNHFKRAGKLQYVQTEINEDFYNKAKPYIESLRKDGTFDDYAVNDARHKFGLSLQNFWHIANSDKFYKYKNIPLLIDKITPITFSISKKDCLDLPPKVYKQTVLKPTTNQMSLIKHLSKYALAVHKGKELTLEVKMMLTLRVLQICGGHFAHHTDLEGQYGTTPVKGKNPKLEYIAHSCKEFGSEQGIIWAVFTDEINDIVKRLTLEGHQVGRLDGQVLDDDRVKTVNEFKAGETQFLVSHPTVGGYGYNFQNASKQWWYSRNYRTEARIQAEDRNYRIGTTEAPEYDDILVDIYWEHQLLKVVKSEQEVNEIFTSHKPKDLFKLDQRNGPRPT